MRPFAPLARASRESRVFTRIEADPKTPHRTFSQPDVLEGQGVEAFVVVLRTRGCRWALSGGCTYCGYVNDSLLRPVEGSDLVLQFERALLSYGGEPILKIYTSGSFFDPYEVPEEAQSEILRRVPPSVRKVNVEAQATDLAPLRLQKARGNLAEGTSLEIGVGIETASRAVARYSVHKEFFFEDYVEASQRAREFGITLKAYVLVKPPFLTEEEAIEDAVESARLLDPFSSTISFNPVNVQKRTLVERLFEEGFFRPPWLWSVVEILQRVSEFAHSRIKCDPVGGGSPRGAHNCGSCDAHVLRAISAFNVHRDIRAFRNLECSCRNLWEDLREMEGFFQGGLPRSPSTKKTNVSFPPE